MTDAALSALAVAAGVAPRWRDVHGGWHDVRPDTLRTVLAALGLPADTDGSIRDSQAMLAHGSTVSPPLVTTIVGQPTQVALTPGRFELHLEDGAVHHGVLEQVGAGALLPPVGVPGYHRLVAGSREVTVAVAPMRCHSIHDAAPDRRLWGLAAQLYSLRRPGDGGLGDFGGLQDLVMSAAAHGAAAVAISPVHAQFSADPDRFSPYSPSSRMALNVLHTRLNMPDAGLSDLVDWPSASRARLTKLRALYAAADTETLDQLDAYRKQDGGAVGNTCPLRGPACPPVRCRPNKVALADLAGGVSRSRQSRSGGVRPGKRRRRPFACLHAVHGRVQPGRRAAGGPLGGNAGRPDSRPRRRRGFWRQPLLEPSVRNAAGLVHRGAAGPAEHRGAKLGPRRLQSAWPRSEWLRRLHRTAAERHAPRRGRPHRPCAGVGPALGRSRRRVGEGGRLRRLPDRRSATPDRAGKRPPQGHRAGARTSAPSRTASRIAWRRRA